MRQVYIDYSATTPVDKRVLDKMLPYFVDDFGNTSSSHQLGRKAENAIETARETIAKIFNCKPNEIIFTSGGSESDNLAIRGASWAAKQAGYGNHLLTTPVEHSAVSKTVQQLAEAMDFEFTILPIDSQGMVDPEEFSQACKSSTTVASIIYANNEVGTIAPIPQLAEQAKSNKVLLHTDAVQAAGQLDLDVQQLGVDLMSISAHKFYGPKGVGALYCRENVALTPVQTGGAHESNRRAGTLNTPGIVGMAEALRLAYEEKTERLAHYHQLQNFLVENILSKISGVELTGHPEQRLPSHCSFIFDGVDTNTLLMHLDMRGVFASGASACKTGNPEPSSVLLAMGYSPEQAMGSLRLSVGKDTTIEDVEYVVETLVTVVDKVRKLRL